MATLAEARLTAGIHNFTCEQGATFRRTVTWTDQDGVAINLSGCTVRMQVRYTYDTATTILSLSSTGVSPAITITNATGKITVVIPAATTASLEEGPAVYDLEVVMSNTEVVRLIQGQFIISPEVTR